MDRQTVYAGQLPRDVDILKPAQFAMVGLAKLAEAVLGSGTVVDGFSLTPSSPASLVAILGAGQVYQLANLEASSWGSLSPDTHSILKQGLALDPQNLTFVAPTTVGFAQNVLVEVQYQDTDTGSLLLPYYNASNPSQPFSGPGNNGQSQSTIRSGAVAVQLKYGVAAASGTQVTPSPDAGWSGLFVVTLAYGQTTITAGSITQYSGAPFIPKKLAALSDRTLVAITSSQSYTVPAGVYRIAYEVWGAGGGGGGASASAASSGGAGAGYSSGVVSVQPGQIIPCVVGTGGTGGTGSTNGAAGGSSSFGSYATATGGGGGYGASSGVQTTVPTQGSGSGGQLNLNGGGAGQGAVQGGIYFGGLSGGAFKSYGLGTAPAGGGNGATPGGGGSGAVGASGGRGGDGLILLSF